MSKLLVHKKDIVESVTVNGFLGIEEDRLIIIGEKGEKVDLLEVLSNFEGETVTFSVKKSEKEDIEIIE